MNRRMYSMNRWTLTIISVVVLCVVVLCMTLVPTRRVSAQNAPPIYNPYPPGILPPDLNSELERVLREVDVIEARALERSKALTPPTLTNRLAVIAKFGTAAVETLGELMNYV